MKAELAIITVVAIVAAMMYALTVVFEGPSILYRRWKASRVQWYEITKRDAVFGGLSDEWERHPDGTGFRPARPEDRGSVEFRCLSPSRGEQLVRESTESVLLRTPRVFTGACGKSWSPHRPHAALPRGQSGQ